MTTFIFEQPVPTYRLYREKSGESGDFWLHCETIPERTHLHNWEIGVHRHDAFFQIFSVTNGSGELIDARREEPERPRAFSAPCIVFIPAGAAHGFRFSRDIDGLVVTALADRLAWIAAADHQFGAYFSTPRIVALNHTGRSDLNVARAIASAHQEISGHGAGRAVLLEALMTQAVVSLARAGLGAGEMDAAGVDLASRERQRFDALETLIAAHFRERRLVAFYAGRLGLSVSHLNRLSREHLGMSVQARIAGRVLEAARRDLVFTPTPIQKIAFALGFQDPAYFNRFFKKMTGMTPGAFRKAQRRDLGGR